MHVTRTSPTTRALLPTPRQSDLRASDRLSLLALALLLVFGAGCRTMPLSSDLVVGPSYEVQNVSQSVAWVPSEVKRVAVLPLTAESDRAVMADGLAKMWPVLLDELAKAQCFEVMVVSPDKLRAFTGRTEWRAEERLPAGLLEYLRVELGCDAVLFSRLTRYHAYPPLVQGYNLKLVRLDQAPYTLQILWAVDEVLDAGDPTVVNGARRYAQLTAQRSGALSDSRFILTSPTHFGHYALSEILDTLPDR